MTARSETFEDGLRFAIRTFAAIRIAFMAVALVTHATLARVTVEPNRFDAVFAIGTLYAVTLGVLAVVRPAPLLAWRRLGLVDLALVTGLVVYTGGPQSPLRFAYFAIPFLVAFVARPSRVALWSLATTGCYVLVCHVLPLPDDPRVPGATVAETAALIFVSLAAIGFSAVLVRLHRAVKEHEARASALAAEIVRIEPRERRRLADALHDGPVQSIAAALRELDLVANGDRAALAAARAALEDALKQLRGEIFDLYPHVLDHAGLAAAVQELVRNAGDGGELKKRVEVDPAAAGKDDVTVMSVLRELLANVVKHARAKNVDVWVSNQGGSTLLVEVRDDGCGFEPPSPDAAAQGHHFGLYATGERLRAIGGSLDVMSVRGRGTHASARIPID